jgi:hypothetical protein
MFLYGRINMNKPQKHLNISNFDGIGYKPENKKIRKMKISKMKICLLQRNLSPIKSKSMENIKFSQMKERDIHKYAK